MLLPDAWPMESWYRDKEDDVSGQCPACSHLPALKHTVQVSQSFPSQTGHCHASASLQPHLLPPLNPWPKPREPAWWLTRSTELLTQVFNSTCILSCKITVRFACRSLSDSCSVTTMNLFLIESPVNAQLDRKRQGCK